MTRDRQHGKRVLAILAAQALALAVLAGGAQAGSPPAPPGCTASSFTFTQPTAQPITDSATTTSSLGVSGVGAYLYDVDVRVFIGHTRPSDLQVFLSSPSGTLVTLTTSNGGTADNVFSGTLFDDDADVPVTDAVFSPGVARTPLVPEEAMAAFIGDSANGTWTLSVFDGIAGDTGTLQQWELHVTTLSAVPNQSAPQTFTATSTTPQIPDAGSRTYSLSNVVGGPIFDAEATTFISHTRADDLDVILRSPSGTEVTLTTDNGVTNDNVFHGSRWDDDAGISNAPGPVTDNAYSDGAVESPVVPEEAMGAFIGEDPDGTWRLQVNDDTPGDTGTVSEWRLHITTATCGAPLQPQPPGPQPGPTPTGCTIVGTEFDDVLTGTPDRDRICGLGGHDTIRGKGGNDVLIGGRGPDAMLGQNGDDHLRGNSQNDFLRGGKGADVLDGHEGPDTLKGGADNDVLRGGSGNDRLSGGDGFDFCRRGSGFNRQFGCET